MAVHAVRGAGAAGTDRPQKDSGDAAKELRCTIVLVVGEQIRFGWYCPGDGRERERDEAITISVGRFWASVVRVRVRVNLSRVSVRRSSKGREGQQWQLLFGRLAG